MKILGHRQHLINDVIKRTKKYYHRDIVELNDILYKIKYHEVTGRTWEQFVNQLSYEKLKILTDELNNSNFL